MKMWTIHAMWLGMLCASAHAEGPAKILPRTPCDASPQSALIQPSPHDEGKAEGLCGHARSFTPGVPPGGPRGGSPREADADTDIIHYLLDIEIIPEPNLATVTDVRVQGVCTTDAASTVNGLTTFTLDLASGLTVNAVAGNVGSWARIGDTVEVTLDQTYNAGEAFQVAVDYEGYPAAGGFGAFQWWTRNTNLAVGTLSEPYYARYWWPCKDSLGDKSTMQLHCTVPNPLVVGSNGVCEAEVALSGDRTRYEWRESYPMTNYLASLAITNYEKYEITYNYDDGGTPATMPVVCYLYPDHWDFGAGEPYAAYKAGCDELPAMLEKMSVRFGQYPFVNEKYGVAETGGSGGLGANMEHQTLSSMWRVDNYRNILTHELGHQWWGDDVTCETWYDIWINEGFASYSEAVYQELRVGGGTSAYWNRVIQRTPGNPDAQTYRTNISSVWAIFSTNDIYNKGAWILHMLRHVMGTTAFFDALVDYRAAYTDDYASTTEFIASMSASFGNDLTWFTDQWVMNPGSPDYEWSTDVLNVNGQDYLRLAIWQRQNARGFGLITMPIDIRVTTAGGSTVHTVWNDDWEEYYLLPIDAPPLTVEFDEDGGTDNRHWIMANSTVELATTLSPPPVIVAATIDAHGISPIESVVQLVFSDDVAGTFDALDVLLLGDVTGAYAPLNTVYVPATRTATITYIGLPNDTYSVMVSSDGIAVAGVKLDGEVDDSAWWDTTLLPSGDGQPGGDAVFGFSIIAGDANCDQILDLSDIEPFVAVLIGTDTDPCHILRANMDNGPTVDGDDIQLFVDALTGG